MGSFWYNSVIYIYGIEVFICMYKYFYCILGEEGWVSCVNNSMYFCVGVELLF